MNTNTHAHVSSISRDCDGTYDRGYTMLAEKGQTKDEFTASVVNHFTEDLEPESSEVVNNDEGFAIYEATEEGYRNIDVVFCSETGCASATDSFRDRSAEAAGY